jgi:predicted nucleotidyltransferase
MTPHELAHKLEHIYGESLRAVVLYGSAAGRDYSKKFSDFNVFCVLSEVTPAMLSKANKVVKKWTKKGNPAPHFFYPEYFERSLDVFPMEFMDMKDRHEVLVGSDPLEKIRIDPKNLRHECESELRGKLIHLRSFYAANFDRPRRIAEIMVESFPTVVAAMRGALRLLGEKPPPDSKAIVEMMGTRVDINPQIFFDIIDIRGGNSFLPRGDDALEHFERYLTELGSLTSFVDQMEIT